MMVDPAAAKRHRWKYTPAGPVFVLRTKRLLNIENVLGSYLPSRDGMQEGGNVGLGVGVRLCVRVWLRGIDG